MKNIEAIEYLKLIRENIESPVPEFMKTGLAITALTYGIDALERMVESDKGEEN